MPISSMLASPSSSIASFSRSASSTPTRHRTVVVGAGFLASYITRHLVGSSSSNDVLLASRSPQKRFEELKHLGRQVLAPAEGLDIARPDQTGSAGLESVLEGADTVVNLVGIMHGTPTLFDQVQWHGAENVARAAHHVGAKLIHVSAIGADPQSPIDYWRTKGLGEQAVLSIDSMATVIRPSLVFGPGDGFFTRFAKLGKVLPFLPVFGGGTSLFQPVYAGDLARAIEIIGRSKSGSEIASMVDGKIVEAGGPKVYTYKDLMKLTLEYAELTRPIVSLPFALGTVQGAVLEQLPENLFTVTRSQVAQLRENNIVQDPLPTTHTSFAEIISSFPPPGISSAPPPRPTKGPEVLTPVEAILPQYLGPNDGPQSGRRTHGKKAFTG